MRRLKSLFASTRAMHWFARSGKPPLESMPVREERQHSNDKDGRYPPSPNAVQNMPFAWAAFFGPPISCSTSQCPFRCFSVRWGLFLAIGKPKHLFGSDGRSLESGRPQRFLAFLYRVNFLTLALTWPWDHQLSEFSYP